MDLVWIEMPGELTRASSSSVYFCFLALDLAALSRFFICKAKSPGQAPRREAQFKKRGTYHPLG